MTVVNEGPLCLKIHLSKYEIKKYFNGYNRINIEDPTAQKTINMLFNIAVNISNFEITRKRLIEVFPTPSGGCILKFTSDPLPFQIEKNNNRKNLKLKNKKGKNNPYIFCFKNFENLISVVEKLYKNHITQKYLSSLFKFKNKFFLKIIIPIHDIKTGILISEFSEYSNKGTIAESLITEYTNLIIENNAIEILGTYFFKKSQTTNFLFP